MKTIANIIHHTNFPLHIFASDGNVIYWEGLGGHWVVRTFDDMGNRSTYKDSEGFYITSDKYVTPETLQDIKHENSDVYVLTPV